MNTSVWIPLRAIDQIREVGKHGQLGHISEFFGVGTLAVSVAAKSAAEALGWEDVGISHDHFGCVDRGSTSPQMSMKITMANFLGSTLSSNSVEAPLNLLSGIFIKTSLSRWVSSGRAMFGCARTKVT